VRTNTWVTLGASAAFGIMAVVLARGWINDAIENEFQQVQPITTETAPSPTISIVVSDIELGFGDELTPDVLKLVDYPEESVPAGAYTSLDELFTDPTQRTVVLARMGLNEAIIDYRISGPGGRGSLSALITEGMRAVAVRVDEVAGVAGFILPGDYVDVVYTRDEESRRNGNNLISDILLQNVKVLGIDQNLNDGASEPDVVNTVTLEVSNENAQKLHLAMDAGKLSLTLRRSGEVTFEPTKTVQQQSLVHKTYKPVSTARRSAPRRAEPSGVANVTIERCKRYPQHKFR